MASRLFGMTSSSNAFHVVLFLLSILVTGLSFISISLPVLELWEFSFIRDWPEIQKSEIPQSEFRPISPVWGKLQIPNLARLSLTDCSWMLKNSRVTAFTVFYLLSENHLDEGGGEGGGIPFYPPLRLGLTGRFTKKRKIERLLLSNKY